jgi:acyl-CoA thioesterase-1
MIVKIAGAREKTGVAIDGGASAGFDARRYFSSVVVLCAALLSVVACVACGERPAPARTSERAVPPPTAAESEVSNEPVVLFLGTSLTAGLGLAESEAYPALIQQRIDSAGLGFRVVNAGVSGETSAGGLRRIDWLLTQPIAVLVLELGANDALRGQDLTATRENLQQIVTRTRTAHPDCAVVIAGMQAPPNLGRQYTTEFRDLFPALALANHATLIPFLLDSVAAVPHLNQADGIHPTAEGDQVVARNVWRVLAPILEDRERRTGKGER